MNISASARAHSATQQLCPPVPLAIRPSSTLPFSPHPSAFPSTGPLGPLTFQLLTYNARPQAAPAPSGSPSTPAFNPDPSCSRKARLFELSTPFLILNPVISQPLNCGSTRPSEPCKQGIQGKKHPSVPKRTPSELGFPSLVPSFHLADSVQARLQRRSCQSLLFNLYPLTTPPQSNPSC